VLKNADFLFESLFECPAAQLAWSGGSETRDKIDLLGSPLIPISPSRAFAGILKGTNVNSDRKEGNSNYSYATYTSSLTFICYFQELEALLSKGKRLFSYNGVDISNSERRVFES